jgi:hypothetical protein
MRKHCKVCDKKKPMDKFYKAKTAKDGHQRACKDCQNSELNAINTCDSCGTEKRAVEFYRSTTGLKRMTTCKECYGPRPDRRPTSSVWIADPVDYERICGHLRQPREGLSDKSLVELWNIFTDFYLPRESSKNEAFKTIV